MMRVMLAMEWEGADPAGWWMSEKLDGVRAVWNGSDFISRNGKTFDAPAWFKIGMPDAKLDGELWLGRGQFQKTAGLARRKGDQWQGMRFMVFDIISDGPFESRLATVRALDLPAHVQVLEQIKCENRAHFNRYESATVDAGGEGVMLREPASVYYPARTYSLRKVKRFSSAECRVMEYTAGTGANEGRLGALLCEWRARQIRIGSGIPNHIRDNPPPVGARITFNYCGLTDSGMPRHPSFVAARDYEGDPDASTVVHDCSHVITDFLATLEQPGDKS